MSKNHFVSYFLPFQINTTIFIFVNLDVRKTISVSFLANSDQYKTFFLNFYKMAAGAHFGCPKFNFDRISGGMHHWVKLCLSFFCEFSFQNGCPKITFGRISGQFRSIQNFFFNFVYKMAAGAHFGCPNFTFDHISGHFRSIRI